MKEDIFASYLKKITEGRDSESQKLSERSLTPDGSVGRSVPAPAVQGQTQQGDILSALKEISAKLDRFSPSQTSGAYGTAGSFDVSGVPGTFGGDAQLMDMAIVNGKVVIPGNGIFELNVYVKNGKVASIGRYDDIKALNVIDAAGKYVIPGIIDPHVHMGLFVPFEEDLKSETKSAALGGITTVGCFIGGQSSHLESFPKISEKIENFSWVDFIPHLVISDDKQRKEIEEYIDRLGVTSFKLYMNGIPGMIPDVDDGFIMDVLEEIKKTGKKCVVCTHAENRYLVRRADRLIREKYPFAGIEEYSATHPAMAEEEAVMRMSYLAEKAEVPVYFVHITSKEAVRRLASLRMRNKFVNVETTSMYLSVSRQDEGGRNEFKMEPPFRDREDVDALWKALEDGVIDTIGTDNTTITREEKGTDGNMWDAVPGYPAEETHLASMLSEGVVKRGFPIEKLITHMTRKPAEMFGIYPQKGTILPGSDADIVIVDMDKQAEVHASQLHSRSDFSVFEGRTLRGWPVTTIKGGRLIVKEGVFIGEKPIGKCLRR